MKKGIFMSYRKFAEAAIRKTSRAAVMSLAEVKIGRGIATDDGLLFVINKKDGFIKLSNGKKIEFLVAVKMKVWTA